MLCRRPDLDRAGCMRVPAPTHKPRRPVGRSTRRSDAPSHPSTGCGVDHGAGSASRRGAGAKSSERRTGPLSVVTVFDGLVSRLFDGLPVSTSRRLWRAREAELATRSWLRWFLVLV